MQQPGHFSSYREHHKRTKYQVHSDSIGARFYPLVLETFGFMGPAFHKFLRYVAFEHFERSSNSDPDSEDRLKSAVMRLWRFKISAVLQRANARLILSKSTRVSQMMQSSSPHASTDFSRFSDWVIRMFWVLRIMGLNELLSLLKCFTLTSYCIIWCESVRCFIFSVKLCLVFSFDVFISIVTS